jgi:hypothetical protein
MNSERFDPLNQTPSPEGQGELERIDHDHYFTHLAWLDYDRPHPKPTIVGRGHWLWPGHRIAGSPLDCHDIHLPIIRIPRTLTRSNRLPANLFMNEVTVPEPISAKGRYAAR